MLTRDGLPHRLRFEKYYAALIAVMTIFHVTGGGFEGVMTDLDN